MVLGDIIDSSVLDDLPPYQIAISRTIPSMRSHQETPPPNYDDWFKDGLFEKAISMRSDLWTQIKIFNKKN